jgi:hypothetical protein
LHAFGVDVLDPQVSTRRVGDLLRRLPPSALKAGELWSTEADLLAVLIDQVAILTWVMLRAFGAKNARRPRPLPRPGSRWAQQAPGPAQDGATGRKAGTWAEAAQALAGMPGMAVDDSG